METLKSISGKNLENVNKLKKEFFKDVISKVGSNNTIIFYCRYYEELFYRHLILKNSFIESDTKITQIVAEITKWVWEEDYIEDSDIGNITFSIFQDYFDKVYEVHQSNVAFLSEHFNIFKAEILENKTVQFNYASKEIEFYENVNNLLITDYRENKAKWFANAIASGKKLKRYINGRYHANHFLNIEFELPDDYSVLGYSIRQLKEFWFHIYNDAWEIKEHNYNLFKILATGKKKLIHDKLDDFRILEINPSKWKLRTLTYEIVGNLLEMFSYNGQKKLGVIHSSLISEPIVQLPDSRYIVIANIILTHEPERYSLQVFDKYISHYQNHGVKVPTDDSRREDIFIDRLNYVFNNYKYKKDSVNIPGSDIDYIVFDENSKTLICFELKWIIEPFTPSEITKKEKSLEKALKKQLPTYKNALEESTSQTLKKAFGNNFSETPINYFYFVLTNISVGSGLLDRSTYKIVNIRMLEKALDESKGDLEKLSRILIEEKYIQNASNYFDSKMSKQNCLGINIIQPEFRYKGGFSLEK
ncbi:hypothetical protein F7731_16815 [Cytobacillus depressus]|uniref:Uncharacterized protein n=1 Tax=Cytobacillus depressus TaxID=1602942 RepID=A0A6L3V244_9BACI|nr:hypothetical protein [Cytobacillus depressus]KAB2332236.1 hypothetical protein F7731_16815 [Cytobacillus depressus]